jgi:hypothetical protein
MDTSIYLPPTQMDVNPVIAILTALLVDQPHVMLILVSALAS